MTTPYTRQFNAQFAREIPRNLLTIYKAQQADMIADMLERYDVTLAPAIEFNRSIHTQVHTPCVTVYRKRTGKINLGGNGMLIESVPVFGLVHTVEGATEDEAQDLCEYYAEGDDSIIRSADPEDLFANLPAAVMNLSDMEITDHIYYPSVAIGHGFRQAVEIVFQFDLTEA